MSHFALPHHRMTQRTLPRVVRRLDPFMLQERPHLRLDHGQFPDLMPQQFRVASRELRPTASACGGPQRLHFIAVLGWNQQTLVFLMAVLPTAFLLRFAPLWLGPRVRMLRTGRQRGVLRRLLPAFKLRNPVQQRQHEGSNSRSHLRFQFRRNRVWVRLVGRHNACRPRKSRSCPDQFTPQNAPRA